MKWMVGLRNTKVARNLLELQLILHFAPMRQEMLARQQLRHSRLDHLSARLRVQLDQAKDYLGKVHMIRV